MFPVAVTIPIALHVRAKRFLCAVDGHYHAKLSAGSERSLQLQGGAFEPAERDAFEQLTGSSDAVQLRRWDDSGKVEGLAVAPLATYRSMLVRAAG